jgi:hypothetical protein
LTFESLKVNAQDEDADGRMYLFNLLIDRVESTLKVQKKQKYRTIVSEDIITKMQDEMHLKRIL